MCDGRKDCVAARFPGAGFNYFMATPASLTIFMQYIPSMLASFDWRVRHAGLMAIAAIGEGTGKVGIVFFFLFVYNYAHPELCRLQVMQNELGKIVEYVSLFPLALLCCQTLADQAIVFYSLVTPMFADSHPRVRYAACQCVYVP